MMPRTRTDAIAQKRAGMGTAAWLAACLWLAWIPVGMACVSGGGATDVGNALVDGRVMDDGTPVAGARVFLMPDGYDPVRGDTTGRARWTVADTGGRFAFTDLEPGNYALEARHPSQSRIAWIRNVDVAEGEAQTLNPYLAEARDLEIRLPADAATDAYAFIPTTDVQVKRMAGNAGTLLMAAAPPGEIPVLGLGRLSDPGAMRYYRVAVQARDSVAVMDSANLIRP